MDKKVILISIDGLRPDAVETCGHPFVNTLRENGCYSPDASSVVPPVTLPAHTSIFYSVPPIRHGIITNDYMPPYDRSADWQNSWSVQIKPALLSMAGNQCVMYGHPEI